MTLAGHPERRLNDIRPRKTRLKWAGVQDVAVLRLAETSSAL